MSKKRYYWLKLSTDFFNSLEIKRLRKMAGGDTFTIIYLKLMIMSLKDDGYINYEGICENIAEELAIKLDEDTDNVNMTLVFLHKVGLLKSVDENVTHLVQVEELTGSENESAQRVRKHRQRAALLGEAGIIEVEALQSNIDVTICNTEKEIEKEKDIEKEKEEPARETAPVDNFPIDTSTKKETVDSIIKEFAGDDSELLEALKGFKDMRTETKSKLTTRAMRLNLAQLEKLTADPRERIDIINQSTMNAWKGFYKLKESRQQKNSTQDFYDNVDRWTQELSGRTGT